MDTRDKLLEAAIRCLQARGYARTTTRDIVAEAGVHLPAVNYFFGSKESLLEEASVEALRRWVATTMEVAADPLPADPRERLRRSVEAFMAGLAEDRTYVVAAVEAFAQAERSDDLRERLASAYREFRTSLAEVLAANVGPAAGGPSEELAGLASVLMALFDGLALQWLIDPDRTPDAPGIARSLDALVAILGAPEPTGTGVAARAVARGAAAP